MSKKIGESKVSSVRLSLHIWPKLRALMQLKGREWLERVIEREWLRVKK